MKTITILGKSLPIIETEDPVFFTGLDGRKIARRVNLSDPDSLDAFLEDLMARAFDNILELATRLSEAGEFKDSNTFMHTFSVDFGKKKGCASVQVFFVQGRAGWFSPWIYHDVVMNEAFYNHLRYRAFTPEQMQAFEALNFKKTED